jgi:hypothetical protein
MNKTWLVGKFFFCFFFLLFLFKVRRRYKLNIFFNYFAFVLDSPYILEGLEPQVSYQFRFAARNDVGFGNWAADEHHTMPKRSNPEEPRILNSAIEGVAMSPYFDRFELRWRIPADNGEEIDKYDIKYCIVSNKKITVTIFSIERCFLLLRIKI